MFHHVTPPEVSSLLRPYFSLRLAASFVARPALQYVSKHVGCISKQQRSLDVRDKNTSDVIKGRSVGPVGNVVYILAVLNSQCVDFMVVFVIMGASSNRVLLIQEHG